jgi:hypothetical protein
MLASIILPIQIEKLALVPRDVQAMGIPYDGGIEVLDKGFDIGLDLVGYPACRSAFRAGCPLARTFLGIVALRLLRALYLDQLPAIKHNGVFLRCRVCEIYFLLLAHRLHFSDGILKKVRLMSTIALEG